MNRYVGRVPQGSQPVENEPVKKVHTDSSAQLFKNILSLYLSNWKWFALSLVVCFGLAYYYLISRPPVYERTVSILIKTEDRGADIWMAQMGVETVSSNLTNEMELMKTVANAYEIARRLNLNVEYTRKGRFYDYVLYGAKSPVKVSFIDLPENSEASFKLDLDKNGKLKLYDFVNKGAEIDKVISAKLNDTIATPVGKIAVQSTNPNGIKPVSHLNVAHYNIAGVAEGVKARITSKIRGKNSTIIDISFRDISMSRAEDVLNTLVGVYNENWIKDRNLRTSNTDKFIRERLTFIEDELGDVEQSISAWKAENLILDVGAEGSRQQGLANAAEQNIEDLGYQMYMTKAIRDYLTDGKHNHQLLPANSGITNSNIERLISEYNNILLERNNHLANSSLRNPLVQDLDEKLDALRGSMLQSMDYELSMLQSKVADQRNRRGSAVSKIASNPQKAQHLLSVERQQKVKEDLYLYLLQRREENELSQAFGAYNNQFIEPPHGKGAPVEPVAQVVFLVALAVGLIIPAGVIGGSEFLNTSVRGRKDLEGLSAPFAGDLPLYGGKKNKGKKGETDENPEVVVVEKKRDVINEAFRVIRTNLEFMLGFGNTNQVVMITSLNPGSGKTFITANLTTALAIRNKKVLAIDLDLRKGSLSKYVGNPAKGLSNYLSGQVDDYRSYIVDMGRVHVLPSGTLPPNPAELLFSERFQELMEELKKEYDYIFLDCPPVEVVADASIIAPYANLTLFIVRVGSVEREMLQDIEQWYHDKKFGNIAILLNGLNDKGKRYGYHKYGYYGYGDNKTK